MADIYNEAYNAPTINMEDNVCASADSTTAAGTLNIIRRLITKWDMDGGEGAEGILQTIDMVVQERRQFVSNQLKKERGQDER